MRWCAVADQNHSTVAKACRGRRALPSVPCPTLSHTESALPVARRKLPVYRCSRSFNSITLRLVHALRLQRHMSVE